MSYKQVALAGASTRGPVRNASEGEPDTRSSATSAASAAEQCRLELRSRGIELIE